MKLLFFRYNSIFEPDCIEAFKYLGLEIAQLNISDYENTEKASVAVADLYLKEKNNNTPFLFVFSINFFPVISDLCQKLGVLYVCWSVDCPVNELLFNQIKNPCNRIFLFDHAQYLRFERYNPGNIFYLPLGTNVDRLQKTVAAITESDKKRFTHDICFIGSLYGEKNPLKDLSLSEHTKGFIDGLKTAQMSVFGCNFIEQALTQEVIEDIKGSSLSKSNEGFVASLDRYVVAHSYIGMDLAETERKHILNELSKDHSVAIYTLSDTSDLPNVQNMGPANTLNEMPKIFNLSKINLNITMRPIETGLSLRVYDVLGSGGFLITNYQAEIPEIFQPDEDIVLYESIPDLLGKIDYYLKLKEKCNYYLTHEDERRQIAINGYEKTLKFHTCRQRITTMFSLLTGGQHE